MGGQDEASGHCSGGGKVFSLLFSTVGLLSIVILYSLAGGFLFQYAEQSAELERMERGRRIAEHTREEYLNKLWDLTARLNILHENNWTTEADVLLLGLQASAYRVTVEDGWDGLTTSDELKTKWNFAGALLFAVTSITTIGYGHVTPKTDHGKILTIFYCVLGLPLTIMYIAKLGRVFAGVFRVIYHTCCCAFCCLTCIIHSESQKRMRCEEREHDRPLEALVIVEHTQHRKPTSIVIGGKTYKRYAAKQVWWHRVKEKFDTSMKETTTVPIYVCLFVMAGYITAGAFMFSLWSEDWSPLEGAYFCFITLTTIGYGDYVPGVAVNQTDGDATKLVLCAVYVFLGLAFIGMCIDLMQADVVGKVRWVGDRMGVTHTDEPRTDSERQKAKIGAKLSNSYDQSASLDGSARSFVQNHLMEMSGEAPPCELLTLLNKSGWPAPISLKHSISSTERGITEGQPWPVDNIEHSKSISNFSP